MLKIGKIHLFLCGLVLLSSCSRLENSPADTYPIKNINDYKNSLLKDYPGKVIEIRNNELQIRGVNCSTLDIFNQRMEVINYMSKYAVTISCTENNGVSNLTIGNSKTN